MEKVTGLPAILIPAYKPDERLLTLVEELVPRYAVVVVDDGGGEAYAPLFEQAQAQGAVVLRHDVNRGKGAAIKTGLAYLHETGEMVGALTADADGQHDLASIERVAAAMAAHPDALILGGRDFSQMPLRSRTGNTITRFCFRLGTGLSINDTQTGLRGLPATLFDKLIALAGERYEYEMNMLLALKDWGTPCVEVPIATIYLDNNSSTHFNAVRDGLRVFSRLLRYTASSLITTVLDYALFCLFLLFWPSGISYAVARVCSCIANYALNLRMVFGGKPSLKNALGYTALALFGMLVGAPVTQYLTDLGLHSVLAKFLIDILLFFFNYFMQKHVVFKKAG